MNLSNKVALITGASRGIGRGICLALAQRGASVVINYQKNAHLAEEVAAQCRQFGTQAMTVKANVGGAGDVEAMFHQIAERFGHLDILVNNAGVETTASFMTISEEEWDRIYAINVKGILLCSQRAVKLMEKVRGVIINISSICAQQVWTGYAHYCSSKAAVDMLTKCMAVELAPLGITVNAIAPGSVDTDMAKQDLSGDGVMDAVILRTPTKRLGKPDDIAQAVVYLCEAAGNWLTGEIITIDGGYRLSGDPIPG